MVRLSRFLMISILSLKIYWVYSQNPINPESQKLKSLFNGKNLKGWDTFIGPPIDDSGKHLSTLPEGLNQDSSHVFSVVQVDGENVIRISGEKWGGLITKNEFQNFHLRLEFKWGQQQWGPKKKAKKDSGILYYSVGDHGADFGNWMRSQEFQIEEGNCGEYWGVAGGSEEIHASRISDSSYVYNPKGPLTIFNEKSKSGRHCRKSQDSENPTGNWNTLDLYCFNGTSIHMVNQKIMMVLHNSAQISHGLIQPLIKGKIQLQSEGAEIFYKNIQVEKLNSLPQGLAD